jgi:hypothetical protein
MINSRGRKCELFPNAVLIVKVVSEENKNGRPESLFDWSYVFA